MADIPKITTGDWRTSRDSLTGAVWAGDEFIASVYPNAPLDWDGRSEYPRIDETRANARLIAAAPDLLRVAELLVSWLDEEEGAHKLCDAARAAIAKAEGRA